MSASEMSKDTNTRVHSGMVQWQNFWNLFVSRNPGYIELILEHYLE